MKKNILTTIFSVVSLIILVFSVTSCKIVDTVNVTPPASEGEKPTSAPMVNEAVPTKEPQNMMDTMTADAHKALNIFLSNFSEASLYEYPTSDYNLISFARTHIMVNSTVESKYVDNDEGVPADKVNQVLDKYMGTSVPLADASMGTTGWYYRDGYFWTVAASGESVSYFSIARNMLDIGDGQYKVEFNTYADEPHDAITSEHYSLTPEDATARYGIMRTGTAIVTKKTYNGKATYELKQLY